jgi:hypothetical protein
MADNYAALSGLKKIVMMFFTIISPLRGCKIHLWRDFGSKKDNHHL